MMAELLRQCPTCDLVFWIEGEGDEDQMPRFQVCAKCTKADREKQLALEREFHKPEKLEDLPPIPTSDEYWQK